MKASFGPYELDPESGTLRKHGIALRLREQAVRVLVALVKRPGKLVTRDELRRTLWNDGTVVDFEVGVNTAVSRLRQVLKDPVGSPRFIETIPKRGYRFIASVLKQQSLAVIPFVNQSGDRDGGYFCDGLTEELIRACWRIDGLRVAGRATVSRFEKQPYDPNGAARELGVDFLLEGSVRRTYDRIRINVHLLNGEDGFEIWTERFDADWKDVFAIQDHVTERIAEALKTRLKVSPPDNRPGNTEAYTAYLKGHFLVKRHSPANSARALQYFEEAAHADPGYALSYHGAAVVHILDTLLGASAPRDGMAKAEELLEKGLAIQTDSAMLQNTLGMLRMFQWRWLESEQAYRRAIALEPSNPHPHMMFALHHSFSGRHEEAWQEARTALDLDPVDPMMNFRVVQAAYYARRYDAAIQSARTAIDLARDFQPPHSYLASALLEAGRTEEAWRMTQKAKELGCGLPFCEGAFGYIAGKLGHTAEARDVIADLTARRDRSYGPALPIAWTWLGLGDVDTCLHWLRTALDEHEPYLAATAVSPIYDRLRPNPIFRRLLRSVGFDPTNGPQTRSGSGARGIHGALRAR
jgi:TolB-like protein/Flp pilus assembly protein TadD